MYIDWPFSYKPDILERTDHYKKVRYMAVLLKSREYAYGQRDYEGYKALHHASKNE